MFTGGYAIAMAGIAICVILCGVGSAIGLYKTGSAAAGILGEDPKKFGKVLILVLLPATQGIYGFIVAIIASGGLSATNPEQIVSTMEGWAVFGQVMPMAISGLVSGFFQGKAAANCIYAVGRQETLSGKLVLYPAMVEFYAILGLIISIMLV